MNILVPIDFSKDAEKALEYAIYLAKKKEASVEMIHIIDLVYDFASQAAIALDSMHTDAHKILNELKSKYVDSGVPISFVIKEGSPSITITKYAQETGKNLIVMGTKGAGGAVKIVFGSTTVNLIKESTIPVLVVPKNADLTQIRGLTLAMDFSEHERKFLAWVVDICKSWEFELSFLHILCHPTFREELACIGLKSYVEKNHGDGDYNYLTESAENPQEGLNNHLERNPDTILVVCHEHKNFWNQLTKKSQSIELAYAANTPLLILI